MRRMLDQTMAWIIGVTASTGITGGLVYGLTKIHINEDEGGHGTSHGDAHGSGHTASSDHASSAHKSDSSDAHAAPNDHGKADEHHAPSQTEKDGDGHPKESESHGKADGHETIEEHGAKPEHHDEHKSDHGKGEEHGSNSAHGHDSNVAHDGHAKGWKYSGDLGPEHWGKLSSEFAKCETGQQQSPINFQTVTPSDRDMPIDFHYRDSILKWGFDGHTLRGEVGPGSYITLEKKRYQLLQFHFHTPSEHTVHGEAYPAELHLVHRNSTGKLAVVGLLIKDGDTNDAMQELIEKIPRTAGATAKVVKISDAQSIRVKSSAYKSH